MGIEFTWLSHATWLIKFGSHRLLVDPFLTDNPTAPLQADAVETVSHILVTHGHFDHVGDVASIANRCQATVVANFEIAQWFANQHQVVSTVGMNIGGAASLPFGSVKMVQAIHSSGLPDGSYGGTAAGFVLELGRWKIYIAGDTALFSDMQLFAKEVDVAVLPIGDLFTMGPDDSIEAIRLIEPQTVLPSHYGTWPPIQQDIAVWAERVRNETDAKPVILGPGESFTLK